MQSIHRPSARTLAALDCFLVLGLLGVYLKIGMLDLQWGAIARFLGMLKAYQVTPMQRLGFYADDIILNLILIPLLATLLVRVLFRSWRLTAALVLSVAASLLYFSELRAQTEVGQYVSRDLLMDTLRWSISNPGMSGEYLTAASVLKLAILLCTFMAIVMVAWLHGRALRQGREHAAKRWRLILAAPALAVLVGGAASAVLGYSTRTNSLLNASSIGRIVHSLAASSSSDARLFPDFEAALAASRLQTHTPAFDQANHFVGTERGDDVMVFIMETGPAEAFDFATSGRELAGVGALLDHAFVGASHYTTYPYTSDAVFSILSGLYPEGRRRLLRRTGDVPLNGLMTALAQDTQMRRVYLPSLYHAEVDDEMYADFGAETIYAADMHVDDAFRTVGERRADSMLDELEISGSTFSPADRTLLRARLSSDLQALERMKADITAAVHAGQRYCVAYLPQVAHGPWIALHDESSVLARGRALIVLQDRWIKELGDLLRQLGRFDHTVFVVTADHGIRTRAEDPRLAIGKISDYMFRVPLLIRAPNALQAAHTIDVPTSHIDLAPTILALLGETTAIHGMQGIPIWQRTKADRLYFWAAAYGGADGFEENGTYYMRQALSGAIYRSGRFQFDDADVLAASDPANAFVNDALDKASRLQQNLVTHWKPLAR